MCLAPLKPFLLLALTYLPFFKLIHIYNNNYNNSYFSLFLSAYNLFCEPRTLFLSHDYSLFCSRYFCKHWPLFVGYSQGRSLNTQLVLAEGLLNYFSLSSALYCLFIVHQDQSNERSWNERFLFLAFREVYRDRLYMCLFLVIFVVGLCVRCIYLYICITHLSHAHTYVVDPLLINSSMYKCVSVVFAYSFHVNDITSFRVTIQ